MLEVVEEAFGALVVAPSWDSAAYGAAEAWRTDAASAAGGAERSGRAASPVTTRTTTASGIEHLWRSIRRAGTISEVRQGHKRKSNFKWLVTFWISALVQDPVPSLFRACQ